MQFFSSDKRLQEIFFKITHQPPSPSRVKWSALNVVKYLSQLQEQFISPIPLVQFNWYCDRGGDNDEALT